MNEKRGNNERKNEDLSEIVIKYRGGGGQTNSTSGARIKDGWIVGSKQKDVIMVGSKDKRIAE